MHFVVIGLGGIGEYHVLRRSAFNYEYTEQTARL